MEAATNKTTNDSLANRMQSNFWVNFRRTRDPGSTVSLLIPKNSTEFDIKHSVLARQMRLNLEFPLARPEIRRGWLCVRTIPQAAIGFAGVRERRRLGPTRAACLKGRDTLRWRDTTRTGVNLTCTRNVGEWLNKRKILGS